MPAEHRPDPFRSFSFRVELDGVILGGFSEVSGLSTAINPVGIHAETRPPATTRRLPGLRKSGALTLKRGIANREVLLDWRSGSTTGRRPATIVLLDAGRRPVTRWHVANAWIHKMESPDLNAAAREVAIETLELGHEGLTIEESSKPGRD
jgi:phage tail-like protein